MAGASRRARFSANGARDPTHCAVVYGDAYQGGGAPYLLAMDSSGC